MRCPHCGEEVETRAKLGSGTQKGANMKVNSNRQAIIDILQRAQKALSVRQIQELLWHGNFRRISQRGAGWNYHTVQADLSILVGMKKVQMRRPHAEERFDSNEGHTTKGVPVYEMSKLQ